MPKKIVFALFVATLSLRPWVPSLAFPQEDIAYSLGVVLISSLLCLRNFSSAPLRKNPLILPIGLLLFALFLSTGTSKNFENSLAQFYKYTAAFFVFGAVSGLSASKQKIMILCLLAVSAIVSLHALQVLIGVPSKTILYLNAHHIRWDFAREYLSRGRAFAPFVLPADLGGYLILFVPISIALLGMEKNKKPGSNFNSLRNIAHLLIFISTTLALLCTQSIGAILSLIAAAGIFATVEKKKFNRRLGYACGIGMAACCALVIFMRNTTPHAFNLLSFSVTNRLDYWKHALSLIPQHPLAGLGPGNYPFFKSVWAHNAYLQVWVETGVFGFCALLGIALGTVKMRWKENTELPKAIYDAIRIGSLAFLIHNLGDSTFLHPEVALQWWVLAAILSSSQNRSPSRP
jgi:O-antigen ligase